MIQERRALLFFLAGVSWLAALSSCAIGGRSFEWDGKRAPYARFIMLDGSVVPLDELRGKRAVVMFWATTCRYSRTVMERLNNYAKINARRKNFEVIAVSVDKAEKFDEVRQRINLDDLRSMRHAFSGNDIYDEAYMAFDVGVLPKIFVIDARGVVIASGSSDDVVYQALK